uniref:tryptophan--tRNA ligase n=1 Tax=Ditylum brightwellii TaxID=49249 RepID=A0A7S4SRK9_9STRA|mmetsp:Transcript_9878/g.13235  ORF Transcript_9878/g.13235 Transcript_9878/m.13235 type:complete len:691 (-) Transcript_9878:338-2410(-)
MAEAVAKDKAGQNDKGKGKKKASVPPPPPPACVSTALLLLRGAIAGVTGCPIGGGDSTPSLMQPTYIKEGKPSGKFSMSLGKKQGTLCEMTIPDESDEEGQEALLNAIETAANRMVEEDLPVQSFQMDRQEAIEKFGDCILDQSQKKPKKGADNMITIAWIGNVILAVPPGPVYSSTKSVGRIVLELGNLTSSVTAGKKARKCEVVLKFHCTGDHPELSESDAAASSPPADEINTQSLLAAAIRFPEGATLKQAAEQKEKAAAEEAAAAQKQEAAASEQKNKKDEEMVVNAFEVSGVIDYNKLVDNFGSKLISEELLARLERLTVGRGTVPRLHRFLRRNIFFSHRDLTRLLDCVEKNEPFYLYTGRGPSSGAMHLGHLVPFLFTQWLQKAFNCPLVIQMTDDEKFLFKGEYSDESGDNLDYFANLTIENARDIIACGFDPEKTFLFSDLRYVGSMYPNIVRIWKSVTSNQVNNIFGFDGSANIGKVAFPAIQAAPSFPSSFPVVLNANRSSNMACLIPCAIDQDPYFRMTRDIAHKLTPKSHPLGGKPALIHSKFFPPLQGATGKMSSSDPNSAVFLTDSAKDIERKIKEFAFSGGQETKKLQEELGADLEADVSYQWLRFFLEDDEELERIGQEYGSGKGEYWSTGDVKTRLVKELQVLVAEHQRRRADVTTEVVENWMEERCILQKK